MKKNKSKLEDLFFYKEWKTLKEIEEDNPIVRRYMNKIRKCNDRTKETYYQRMIIELVVLIESMYENLSNINVEAEAGLEDYFDIMGDPK